MECYKLLTGVWPFCGYHRVIRVHKGLSPLLLMPKIISSRCHHCTTLLNKVWTLTLRRLNSCVLDICDGKNLWQWSRLKVRLDRFSSVNHSKKIVHHYHHQVPLNISPDLTDGEPFKLTSSLIFYPTVRCKVPL